MFNELYEVIKCLHERNGVYQLIREVPGVNIKDQEMLIRALEAGVIPTEFPNYTDMVNTLAELPTSEEVDLTSDEVMGKISQAGVFADKSEVQGLYLKNILLPIARGKRPSTVEDRIVGLSKVVEDEVVDMIRTVWFSHNIMGDWLEKDLGAEEHDEHISLLDLVDFFIDEDYINQFGIDKRSKEVYNSLSEDDKRKLVNKAVSGRYV